MFQRLKVPSRFRLSRTVIMIFLCLSLVLVFNTYNAEVNLNIPERDERAIKLHKEVVDRFFESHKSWKMTNLGSVLYKNEKYPNITEEMRRKTFVLLIWKHWNKLQNRHVLQYSSTRHDPFEGCSVNNCKITGDDSMLDTADAVVVHLHRGEIPIVKTRNPAQKWVFLNDESPYNVFTLAKRKPKYTDLHNVFNWSMTYRSDSDVPVPYGRTIALEEPKFSYMDPPIVEIIPHWKDKTRDVLVAILLSNCNVAFRKKLIKELEQNLKVNVHGNCGDKELKHSCPGHFRTDCKVISKYLFYLALENSMCKDYITEKVFYNAYSRGAIPIIMGPSLKDCKKYLPPDSYLHVDNYATTKDLADDILRISRDNKRILHYHQWRNHFEVVNEHAYFGTKSLHFCRLCEAMNYNNDKPFVYKADDLKYFLDPKVLCKP